MVYMERVCPQSLRRPRTQTPRKPRLGRHLYFELPKTIVLPTSLEKNAPQTPAARALSASLNAENGTVNQTFKASHRKDRQRGPHNLQRECFQETRKTSQGSSESDTNGLLPSNQNVAKSKHGNPVNIKDLNNLAGQSHVNEPDLSSRAQSHRRRVVPRKFYDDDTDNDRCFWQKGKDDISRGHNSSQNALKYNAHSVRKAEYEFPSHRNSSTKQFQNKVLKRGSPFEAMHHSDEGAHLMQDMHNWSSTRVSPCVSEARRHRHNMHTQENTPERDSGQVGGEESSGDDAVSDFNDQSTLDLEHSMHMNFGFGDQGASILNDKEELSVPTVRKSSRVPKKRIFDEDDESPLKKKTKSQIELAAEHAEQEESTDGIGIKQLANECCEREITDIVGDDPEFHVRECFNNSDETFLDKKELPLTARQQALRIIKEGGDSKVSTSVDVPNSLQPALPKGKKENLTEAEQAIKKEEAARRRKQQMEKNDKEIQAAAIQKILGQESSRKRREEKLQKQREEIEQEKQAAAMAPAVNSIRWVMGPSGNVVSFSQDIELPKIFSGPCSYPQERERCAGPSCNNVYKYRDSKTRLPLCSLQCYRAVREMPSTGSAF